MAVKIKLYIIPLRVLATLDKKPFETIVGEREITCSGILHFLRFRQLYLTLLCAVDNYFNHLKDNFSDYTYI